MTQSTTSSAAIQRQEAGSAVAPVYVVSAAATVLAVLLGWMFWDFVWRQLKFAYQLQADWAHTLVIPFIAGYFIYLRRDDLKRIGFRTTWIGLLPVILGIGWYMLCVFGPQPLHHHNLRGAGVGVSLFGIVLLFCGWRAMTILWFPLLYLIVFGQTISDKFMFEITQRMQDITAVGGEIALALTGMDVERTGNILYVYDPGATEPRALNIAEACSGMRMLMAFLALGVAMAYTGLKRFWQQALLVVMAVPTAIVVNVLRVVTLAWLSRYNAEFTAGDFHTFIGLVWLVPAFLIYLGLMWIIRNLVTEPPLTTTSKHTAGTGTTTPGSVASTSEPRSLWNAFDNAAPKAFIVLCLTLLVSRVGFTAGINQLNIHLSKKPVELRHHFSNISTRLGEWRAVGKDTVMDEAVIETLGTNEYLSRTYAIDGDPRKGEVAVHLAYYTGIIDTVPHVPDRCFLAGGFNITEEPRNLVLPVDRSRWLEDPGTINQRSGEPYPTIQYVQRSTGRLELLRMPLGDLEIRTTEFNSTDHPDMRFFAGYFFIANNHITPTPWGVKALAFDPREEYAYYCKVQFMMRGNQDFTEEAFLQTTADLAELLFPEIMWCLPDWPTIEARQLQAQQSGGSIDGGSE